jgi:uncharacterized protein
MSTFIVDLATLHSGLNRLVLEGDASELGLPPATWPGRISGTLDVEKSGEQVTVRGPLLAVVQLECVRCLRSFELRLQPPFELFAERAGSSRNRNEEAELERDHFMKFHDGRRLDLGEEIREALLLELPMTPRCREDCRGLCPACGADLNEGPCGCKGQPPA